jgi:peptidoglycan/LPS O-acetylase OafA/YrhL
MPSGAAPPIGNDHGDKPAAANNFNALRLVFALMVVAYHAAVLPGLPAWKPAEASLSLAAEIGVEGFFVLSGYLVFTSLKRSNSLQLYAEKRARRLYPAYAAIVAACAFGALLFSAVARTHLGGVFHYFIANISFLNFIQPNLPGVFEANRFNEVNGALWTLKIEVLFYLLLPALAWILRAAGRYRWAVVALIYVAAEVWRIGLEQAGRADASSPFLELSRQLPGQMSFFITGIAFALLNPTGRNLHRVGATGAILFGLSLVFPWAEPFRALGLGAFAVWAATGAPRLPDAARFGDLSYGIYIVHFPIIQTVVALGLFAAAPWAGLALSAILAIGVSLLLWHFIERPSLRADSAYRTAA